MKKDRFLVYATVFLIMGLSNAVIPILPELASGDHTDHNAFVSSLLFSAYFIGALSTMLPFGILSDRYGKKRLIVFSMVLTSVAGIMLMVLNDIYWLILARLIEGTACGAFFPSAFSLLSEYKEKGRFFGEFNFLLNAGLAAGVIISGYIAQDHIKGGIFLFTVPSVLLLVIGVRDMYDAEKVRDNKIITLVNIQMHSVSEIRNISFQKNYILIWYSSFLLFGVTGVVLSLYPDYSAGLLSKAELGMALASMYASSMITTLIAGRIRLHYGIMIRSGLLLAATGTILAVYYPIYGFILIGVGSGIGLIGLPVAVSYMQSNKGLLMGIFNTYTYAGMGFMPIIAGALVPVMGFRVVFFFCSLALCLPLLMKNKVELENNT